MAKSWKFEIVSIEDVEDLVDLRLAVLLLAKRVLEMPPGVEDYSPPTVMTECFQ